MCESRVRFDAVRIVCPDDIKSSETLGDSGDAKSGDGKVGSGWARRVNDAIRSNMDKTAIAIVPVAVFCRDKKGQAGGPSSSGRADARALVDIRALTKDTCAVLLCQARESPIVSDL